MMRPLCLDHPHEPKKHTAGEDGTRLLGALRVAFFRCLSGGNCTVQTAFNSSHEKELNFVVCVTVRCSVSIVCVK